MGYIIVTSCIPFTRFELYSINYYEKYKMLLPCRVQFLKNPSTSYRHPSVDRDCKWCVGVTWAGETIKLLRSMSVPSHQNMVFQSFFILTSVQFFSIAAFTDL